MSTQLVIQDFDDPTFDPFSTMDEGFGPHIIDPYPLIAEKRAESAVHKEAYHSFFDLPLDMTMADLPHATVLGYDALAEVYSDPATYSNSIYERNLGAGFGRSISLMDPPDHPRYRKIFQRAFLPNIVAKWGESLVAPVISDLMDKFQSRGKADLIREFTSLYPFHIIYRQLNLPTTDIETFHKLAVALTCTVVDVKHAMEANVKLGAYYEALTTLRTEQPGDDLVSLIASAEVDGERLPREIVVSFLRQLMNAAGDTTYRATSNLLVGLLSNPEQLEALRRDRSLIPNAIDEVLRWECPVLVGSRITTRDVTLAGVDLPAGTVLDVANGAANRDPAHYSDPDSFNIFRPAGARHFGFAYGPHVCIGQHLAKVEMSRALDAILNRLPNIRLDPDMPPPVIRGVNMRVPTELHVLFD